ncbi:Repeat domain-containing protein [Nannocystis exedens]|uniref:Repeat domain-containing protein n=1 Tax=Nannocystis exedens TaxID=54 RepID=A0A1I2FQF8_9BACT|nr:VCBS repeat-containing protein [Nannocystis exedens]PCC74493.1 FG-GAP repeat protein [Nannocystis exedens]SFF06686.1 Repeat domain-containing protein [Nannocystis exedens]
MRRRTVVLVALGCACNERELPGQTDAGGPVTTRTSGDATASTAAPATSGELPTTGAATTDAAPDTCGNGVVEPGEVCLGPPRQIDVGPVHRVWTADVDRDGRDDVLTPTGLWLQRDGGLEPGSALPLAPAGIGDFDGDGRVDLFAYDGDARTLAWSRGDGQGSFGAPVVTDASELRSAAAADVDGDGRSDIVAQAPELDALRTYAAADDGSFVPLEIGPMSRWAALTGIGDADGDGLPDVLVSESGVTTPWWGQGDGTFVASDEPLPPQASYALADLEGDGADELLFAHANEWWDDALYAAGAMWLVGPPAEWPVAQVELADVAIQHIAGDMSQDGLGDVIVGRLGEPGQAVLEVLCSAPGRQLGRCASAALTSPVEHLAAADVQADGALDLVFAAGEAGLWTVVAGP